MYCDEIVSVKIYISSDMQSEKSERIFATRNFDLKQFSPRIGVNALASNALAYIAARATPRASARTLSRAIPVTRPGGFCLGILAEETPERVTL